MGRDIEVKVLGYQGGEVKLGVTAPKEVIILRREIFDEIEAQNKESSNVDPGALGKVLDILGGEEK